MASPLALSTTAKAILGILTDARPLQQFPDLQVRLLQPPQLANPQTAGRATVGICPYRVTHNMTRRNLAPRIEPTTLNRFMPSAAMDLHLMFTAWAADPEHQLALIGWVIRTLEDNPGLEASFLNRYSQEKNLTFRGDETVELTAEVVTQADLNAIWQVAPTQQQPSLTYVARMILIDSTVAVEQAPSSNTRFR